MKLIDTISLASFEEMRVKRQRPSASNKNKRSLNDRLDSVPSLLPDLTGLLMRFREFKFAFHAGINPISTRGRGHLPLPGTLSHYLKNALSYRLETF